MYKRVSDDAQLLQLVGKQPRLDLELAGISGKNVPRMNTRIVVGGRNAKHIGTENRHDSQERKQNTWFL